MGSSQKLQYYSWKKNGLAIFCQKSFILFAPTTSLNALSGVITVAINTHFECFIITVWAANIWNTNFHFNFIPKLHCCLYCISSYTNFTWIQTREDECKRQLCLSFPLCIWSKYRKMSNAWTLHLPEQITSLL